MRRREHTVWHADHDNGWVTVIAENQDGTWAAWAFPKNETASIDYIEQSADRARAAALHALEWKSGHTDCTGCCSVWFPEQ